MDPDRGSSTPLPTCCTILRVTEARAIQTLVWHSLRGAGDGVRVMRIENHAEGAPHDHVFHELVFVETGTADHRSADGVRKLRPGDLIVLRPQVWHAYERPRSLEIVNCLIDSPLMQRLRPLLDRFDNAFELLHRRSRRPGQAAPVVLHASPAERAALRERFDAMMAEQQEKRTGWQAANEALLMDVLVRVLRLHAGSRDAGPASKTSSRIEQAVLDTASYLESNFTDPASLADLAQRVHLSPGHLSRMFSRRMGMGIVAYLHRMRAEEACRLLRCTDEPVARIASRLGYDEVAYFSRCFRAQIGQSPREYRRNPRRTAPAARSPRSAA